jgi:dinuclear metal center YbgI/SA1388 family protein
MTKLKQIISFLDNYLKVKEIEDKWAYNGLQVAGRQDVNKILFAVDASLTTFKKAKEQNADMIIVHHGLIKPEAQPLVGVHYNRIKVLLNNRISLYSVHIPLDVHPKIGNNAQFFNLLKIPIKESFGKFEGIEIGYIGELKKEVDFKKFVKIVEKKLNTKAIVFPFGKKKIRKISFCSGGGGGMIGQAIEKEVDVYISGDATHSGYLRAKDGKINVIAAGHYATETLGVKALAKILEKRFKVKTIFADLPTGL